MNLVVVGIDPSETADHLRAFQQSTGHPGTVVMGTRELLDTYKVLIRSSKVAVDRHGVITRRGGYGELPQGGWSAVFQELVDR